MRNSNAGSGGKPELKRFGSIFKIEPAKGRTLIGTDQLHEYHVHPVNPV
ncbi:MAG: hypothetical protein ACC651_04835 [Candidatus Scalindua sp.]